MLLIVILLAHVHTISLFIQVLHKQHIEIWFIFAYLSCIPQHCQTHLLVLVIFCRDHCIDYINNHCLWGNRKFDEQYWSVSLSFLCQVQVPVQCLPHQYFPLSSHYIVPDKKVSVILGFVLLSVFSNWLLLRFFSLLFHHTVPRCSLVCVY